MMDWREKWKDFKLSTKLKIVLQVLLGFSFFVLQKLFYKQFHNTHSRRGVSIAEYSGI